MRVRAPDLSVPGKALRPRPEPVHLRRAGAVELDVADPRQLLHRRGGRAARRRQGGNRRRQRAPLPRHARPASGFEPPHPRRDLGCARLPDRLGVRQSPGVARLRADPRLRHGPPGAEFRRPLRSPPGGEGGESRWLPARPRSRSSCSSTSRTPIARGSRFRRPWAGCRNAAGSVSARSRGGRIPSAGATSPGR